MECQACGRAFDVKVLQLKAEDAQAARRQQPNPVSLMNNIGKHLNQGMPVEYLVRDITATGLDRDLVLKMVNEAIGADRVHCQSCGLSYAPSITTCPECGAPVH